MLFYLYFFTHSRVFHKYSLKSPLSLSNFPQIPYAFWLLTLILNGTSILQIHQKFKLQLKNCSALFSAICVWSQMSEVILHPWRQLKSSRAGIEAGATCCGCRAVGGGHEVDPAGSPELQVTASGASRHEPLWSCWWLGSVTFYDG